MTSSAEGPGTSSDPPANPMDASRRYASPSRRITPATGRQEKAGDHPNADTGQGMGGTSPSASNPRTPMILGVVGIVCWFLCGVGAIASVVLGIIGQRKARDLGQSDLVPKVAWIGGIVVLVLDVIGFIVLPPTYSG